MTKQAFFSKPMSGADGTLMMLLSLNLLLIVFFMLLNSMAAHGQRHASEVLAEVRRGYALPAGAARADQVDVPEVPLEVWRDNVVTRVQGVTMNRLDLRVSLQPGNAGVVELTLPLTSMFDTAGTVLQPELVGNITTAAGKESRVTWQVVGTDSMDTSRLSNMTTNLALVAGKADLVRGDEAAVRIRVIPGLATRSGMGLQVQDTGEAAGATVQGIHEIGGGRE
ncbi:MAG: hypothetical protein EON60_00795 [Alphaproteobacteria bacterium]|nr:MAG: hypothetical protein EON60_00795 [Alphaproteobacteria bacterium]